jgi:spermidine/putrescine transport system ATP-binding protein
VNDVFQSYALFSHVNVADIIFFGLKIQAKEKAPLEVFVDRILALVKLKKSEKRLPQ